MNRTNGGERNDGRLQGRPQSEETRQKLSDAAFMREQTISDATKAARSAKISATRTGVPLSDEHKAAMSAAITGVPKELKTCPWCKSEVAPTPFSRYHGDECLERPGLSTTFCNTKGEILTWAEVNQQKQNSLNGDLNQKREESREIVLK